MRQIADPLAAFSNVPIKRAIMTLNFRLQVATRHAGVRAGCRRYEGLIRGAQGFRSGRLCLPYRASRPGG